MEEGHAWASDGHILVCIPITMEANEQGGLVPRTAIEAADKAKGRLKSNIVWDTENDSWFVPGMGMHIAAVSGAFPQKNTCEALMARHETRLLSVDITLLIRAAKILSDTKLVLYYAVKNDELLYMENTLGERIIVAPVTLETGVLRERAHIERYWLDETL